MSGTTPAEQQAALAAFVQQQVDAAITARMAPGGAAQPAAIGSPARAPEPRMPPPPTFDGRAASLDPWLAALNRQFAWYGYASPANDAQRMRFATAYLSAAAWDWWEHAPVALQTGGWNDFVSALRRRFQPVTSAETARLQLRALAQGKSSVHDYVAAFRRLLVAVPSMSEDDRLFQFMQGLRPAIAAQLRIHGVKTMDAAVEMAARIGSFGELNASLSASAASSAPAAVALSGADDMQLDNIEGLDSETSAAEGSTAPVTQAQLMALINAMKHERGSNRTKEAKSGGKDVAAAIGKRFHLTPEQVREHFDKGQCFNCHSTEHSSRACPKQKKSSN